MTNKLYKNLVNFTAKSDARPILQAAHFAENGNIYATNSHIAIVLLGLNKAKADFNLNLKTMEQLDGAYPAMDRLIPDSGQEEKLDLDVMVDLAKFLKGFKKERARLNFKDGQLLASVGDSVFIRKTSSISDIEYLLSVDYLLICLQVFIDEKMNATLLLSSALRPILFFNDSFKIMLMPMRGDIN